MHPAGGASSGLAAASDRLWVHPRVDACFARAVRRASVLRAAGVTAPAPADHASPTPTDAELALEGAVPEPAESSLPTEEHRQAAGSRFALPLKAWSTQTDRYGAYRGPGFIHGGIDLALDDHGTVYASCAGFVASAAYSATYGNNVVIDCGGGWSTLSAHMSQLKVTQGQLVAIETAIGVSGSTGFSTGEHLHFEIRYNGTPVNPEHYLDFHIPAGAPLSTGPIYFGRPGGSAADATPAPTIPGPTATITPTPTKTATPTNTPTVTPTPTWTPTPKPPTATPTKTPRPVIKQDTPSPAP